MNQQFYKNLALWVVILVVMLLLFTTLKQNEAAPSGVSAYSEFVDDAFADQSDRIGRRSKRVISTGKYVPMVENSRPTRSPTSP